MLCTVLRSKSPVKAQSSPERQKDSAHMDIWSERECETAVSKLDAARMLK